MGENEEELPKRAKVIMDLRGYKENRRDSKDNRIDVYATEHETGRSVLMRVFTKKTKSNTVGVKLIRELAEEVEGNQIDIPIVVGGHFTRSAKRMTADKGIQRISEESLPPFNIFDHELMPKHIILNSNEVAELLERFKVKLYQLPMIKKSDPAVIAIGAKTGDVIKIVRKSQTAGEAVYYRYVVN